MKRKVISFKPVSPKNTVVKSFDAEYQLDLLKILYKRPTFCSKISLYLDPFKHFDLYLAKWLGHTIIEYNRQYHSKPKKRSLLAMLDFAFEREEVTSANAIAIRDFIKNDLGKLPTDESFIIDLAQNFITFQVQMDAAEKVIIAAEKGDIELARTAFAEGASVSFNFGKTSVSYVQDTERAIKARKKAHKNTIPSGLPIDSMLQHGAPERQHICVEMAATGVGKTATAVHIGATQIMAGYKVAHVIIESTEPELRLRYDAALAGINQEDVEKNDKKIVKLAKRLERKFGDPLRYVKFSPGTLTPYKLRAWIMQLRSEGFIPDSLIIDSPDDMIPDEQRSKEDNDYKKYGNIYVGILNVIEDFNLGCWVTTQGNREALEANVLKLSMISDSLKKVQKASLVVATCQTFKESLAKPYPTARKILLKNRWGRKNVEFRVTLDWGKQRIIF